MSKESIQPQDHRVRELAQLRLTVRNDLKFTPHFESGEPCYLIEDAARSQFFRVGISEYLLISMFDGTTSVGDALVRLSQLDGDHALTEAEATSICKWLVDSELAYTPESTGAERLAKNAVDRAIRKRLGAWNPLSMKLPLAYPDRLFAKITPSLSWLFGLNAALVGLVVAAVAIYKVALGWDSFMQASSGIFSPGRWIWLALCWLALKVIHESAHAIVCRKYGGAVHEAGAIFVLFAPLAYVDLTSSWRFRSKWKRIHTAAAGMYIELWIAAIAAIVWSATAPGLVNHLCFNVIVMASLTTIVFNANPLMRFDGYYILSDLFEIPNLYSGGQQYTQYVGRRYILGEKINSSLRWSSREIFTRVYGFAALLWRVFICASLIIAASLMFHGLGIILAAVAVVLWIGVPFARLIKHVCRRDGMQRQRKTRLAISTLALAMLAFFAFNAVCWPGAKKAPAIVQYEPLAFVRASSPGFVRKIHVLSGQRVDLGQPIAELENRQLVAELKDLEIAIEQSLLKSRVFKQNDEMHSYQAEMEQLHAYQEKRDEKRRQVELLTLRATASGRVIARDLVHRIGTYLHEGDELAAIGDESRKELQIAISQSDFDPFEAQIGNQVNVRISGSIVLECKLERVDPRATNHPPHESMHASLGGSLESRALSGEGNGEKFELLAPHFSGVVQLTPSQSKTLRVGQRGVVWFGRNQETIGSYLKRKLRMSLPASLAGIGEPLFHLF